MSIKERELTIIAELIAIGNAQPQLKVHINAGLNVGCSPKEITEVVLQMALYAGFPAALNATFLAKEIFEERGIIKENGDY